MSEELDDYFTKTAVMNQKEAIANMQREMKIIRNQIREQNCRIEKIYSVICKFEEAGKKK